MTDADQTQQHGMTPCLLLRAFERVDHQNGGFGIGSARDHVPQELAMTRCIDDHELTAARWNGIRVESTVTP